MTCNNRTRLRTDFKGSVALEFGLIMPLIILILIGELLFTDYMFYSSKASLLAHSIANLESSTVTGTLSKHSLETDIKKSILHIAGSRARMVTVRVSSVLSYGNGNNIVDWSYAFGVPAYSPGDSVKMIDPPSGKKSGIYVILTEVNFKLSHYNLLGFKLPNSVSDEIVTVSRYFDEILCSDCQPKKEPD